MTRTLSIAIKENTYQDLKQKIGPGKISSFVNQVVEKELKELVREQKKEKTELKKRLIAGYKTRSKNNNIQKMLQNYGEMSLKDLSAKLGKQKKDARTKK